MSFRSVAFFFGFRRLTFGFTLLQVLTSFRTGSRNRFRAAMNRMWMPNLSLHAVPCVFEARALSIRGGSVDTYVCPRSNERILPTYRVESLISRGSSTPTRQKGVDVNFAIIVVQASAEWNSEHPSLQ